MTTDIYRHDLIAQSFLIVPFEFVTVLRTQSDIKEADSYSGLTPFIDPLIHNLAIRTIKDIATKPKNEKIILLNYFQALLVNNAILKEHVFNAVLISLIELIKEAVPLFSPDDKHLDKQLAFLLNLIAIESNESPVCSSYDLESKHHQLILCLKILKRVIAHSYSIFNNPIFAKKISEQIKLLYLIRNVINELLMSKINPIHFGLLIKFFDQYLGKMACFIQKLPKLQTAVLNPEDFDKPQFHIKTDENNIEIHFLKLYIDVKNIFEYVIKSFDIYYSDFFVHKPNSKEAYDNDTLQPIAKETYRLLTAGIKKYAPQYEAFLKKIVLRSRKSTVTNLSKPNLDRKLSNSSSASAAYVQTISPAPMLSIADMDTNALIKILATYKRLLLQLNQLDTIIEKNRMAKLYEWGPYVKEDSKTEQSTSRTTAVTAVAVAAISKAI